MRLTLLSALLLAPSVAHAQAGGSWDTPSDSLLDARADSLADAMTASSPFQYELRAAKATRLVDRPSAGGATVLRLPPLTVVTVLDHSDGYWSASYDEGGHAHYGFVHSADLTDTDGYRMRTDPQTATPTQRAASTATRALRSGRSVDAVCADFSSRSTARAAFAADPVGLAALDGDRDGQPCEAYWRAREARTQQRARTISTPASVSRQCSGSTRAGNRCRRTTTSSNGRCYQHGG